MYVKIHARVNSSLKKKNPILTFKQRQQEPGVEILLHDFLVCGFCVFLPFNMPAAFQSLWCESLAVPISKPKQLSNVWIENVRHPELTG